MRSVKLTCPFETLARPLEVELDPADRSVGIMNPAVVFVYGPCRHVEAINEALVRGGALAQVFQDILVDEVETCKAELMEKSYGCDEGEG